MVCGLQVTQHSRVYWRNLTHCLTHYLTHCLTHCLTHSMVRGVRSAGDATRQSLPAEGRPPAIDLTCTDDELSQPNSDCQVCVSVSGACLSVFLESDIILRTKGPLTSIKRKLLSNRLVDIDIIAFRVGTALL